MVAIRRVVGGTPSKPVLTVSRRHPRGIRTRAIQQHQMLVAAENLGTTLVREYAKAFQERARWALRTKRTVRLDSHDIQILTDELLDLMMLAFVRRYKRRNLQATHGLNLSFDDEVSNIAQLYDLDLGDIRSNFSWIARKYTEQTVNDIDAKINQVIADAVAEQKPESITAREVLRQLDDLGISVNKPYMVDTLVRTSSQIAFNAAQYQQDQDDEDNIIWGYTYVTMRDERVRPEHEELDGITLPKDDPFWDDFWPPNGWNCRCQVVSILNPQTSKGKDPTADQTDKDDLPEDLAPDDGFDFNPGKLLELV